MREGVWDHRLMTTTDNHVALLLQGTALLPHPSTIATRTVRDQPRFTEEGTEAQRAHASQGHSAGQGQNRVGASSSAIPRRKRPEGW